MPDPWEQMFNRQEQDEDRKNARIAELEEENRRLKIRLDTSEENIRLISEAWRKKATQLEADLARERER